MVRGRYVRLAEVAAQVARGCPRPIKAVHIVAEHTLFLDQDLALHEQAKVAPPALLTIVAPR